ncbi:MAG: alcohol dehydrogenase, partial [Thermoleophilia bacterium]
AAVALAWLRSRPTVVSPIASARSPEQLAELLPFLDLDLSLQETSRLDQASGA